ncbi:conserved hypothetical protein [Sphingomonas sp. 8AM]|nr:conserved hypothetical protein [Sphingomonas sp. 8AM]
MVLRCSVAPNCAYVARRPERSSHSSVIARVANHEAPGASADHLFNRPEDRMVAIVLHPDPHRVALAEVRCLCRAALDRLDGPQFRETRIADAALRDRPPRPAIGVAVGDGARSDDRPRTQRARPGGMRDQRPEVESHVLARLGTAERRAVHLDQQAAVQLAVTPPLAQRRRCHEHRREGRGRLGLQKAEPLGEFGRDQVAQRHVVGQPDQPDRVQRLFARRTQRHVAGDDHHFALQIAAPILVGERDRIARAEEAVRPALIHQRIVPEAVGQLRATRLPHQCDMVHVRRPIDPLVSARQRRGGVMFVEALARDRLVAQIDRQQLERGGNLRPVVERGLQRRADMPGIGIPGQIVRYDDQATVAPLLQTGEFHALPLLVWTECNEPARAPLQPPQQQRRAPDYLDLRQWHVLGWP